MMLDKFLCYLFIGIFMFTYLFLNIDFTYCTEVALTISAIQVMFTIL